MKNPLPNTISLNSHYNKNNNSRSQQLNKPQTDRQTDKHPYHRCCNLKLRYKAIHIKHTIFKSIPGKSKKNTLKNLSKKKLICQMIWNQVIWTLVISCPAWPEPKNWTRDCVKLFRTYCSSATFVCSTTWKTSLLHSNTQYHVFDKHIVQTEVYMVYATTVHVYHMWFIFTR